LRERHAGSRWLYGYHLFRNPRQAGGELTGATADLQNDSAVCTLEKTPSCRKDNMLETKILAGGNLPTTIFSQPVPL
jgi:hypothetical protein